MRSKGLKTLEDFENSALITCMTVIRAKTLSYAKRLLIEHV